MKAGPRVCPQPWLAPFSHGHTSASIGCDISITPLVCELRWCSVNESGFHHFSTHTGCFGHSVLFLWKQQLHLTPRSLDALVPPPEPPCPSAPPPPFPSTRSRWCCDGTMQTDSANLSFLFLSLSPPPHCEGRLVSHYLFWFQHSYSIKKKMLNGGMNAWVNKKTSVLSINRATSGLSLACKPAELPSHKAGSTAWRRHKGQGAGAESMEGTSSGMLSGTEGRWNMRRWGERSLEAALWDPWAWIDSEITGNQPGSKQQDGTTKSDQEKVHLEIHVE